MVPEKRRRNGQSDHVVPPHDGHRAVTFEHGLYDYGVYGGRGDAQQDQDVSVGFAAVYDVGAVVEDEKCGAGRGEENAYHAESGEILFAAADICGDKRYGRTEGCDGRGVDWVCV